MTVRFHVVKDSSGVAPRKAYKGDAGFDIYASEDVFVQTVYTAKRAIAVPSYVVAEIPEGHFGLIQERSSQGKRAVITVGNIIDCGYQSPFSVMLVNLGEPFWVKRGEKVGQFIVIPCAAAENEEKLPVRGNNGFGSSGDRYEAQNNGQDTRTSRHIL